MRASVKPDRMSPSWEAYLILGFISGLMVTEFLFGGSHMVPREQTMPLATSNFVWWEPVTSVVGMAMKPLGLREIADEVGLHESTVSRVTNNKYMATPLGVFELKYFFSRAMTSSSGGAFSATAIRGLIKEMIAAEKPSAPLSDAEIARQLAAQGLVLARRTVTKYRQVLRIEPVERRRRTA